MRVCLFEKKIDFKSRGMNLQKSKQHDPGYLKLNSKGVVPTLVHGGEPVTESSHIIRYFDAVFPEPSLTPKDPSERARMEKRIRWTDGVGCQAVFVATWDVLSRPIAFQFTDEELDDDLSRGPTEERRAPWKAVAREGFAEKEIEESHKKAMRTLHEMEHDLADGPWLAGSVFSLGDIAMIPFVGRMFHVIPELGDPKRIPRTIDWFERTPPRPAFDKTFFFEGIDTRVGVVRKRQQDAGMVPDNA